MALGVRRLLVGLQVAVLGGGCQVDRVPHTEATAELAATPAALILPVPPGDAPRSTVRSSAAPAPADSCPPHLRCDYQTLKRDPATQISAIRVEKGTHQLHLLAGEVVVRSYSVALGFGGAGPKKREGDGVTPTGTYKVTGRLPTSPWHILIGVSYPNYEDVKRFAQLKASGEVPHDATIGSGIALHGRRKDMADGEHKKSDWTLGCIAVDNDEIEEIAKLIKKGTPITIVD